LRLGLIGSEAGWALFHRNPTKRLPISPEDQLRV
jgi:hypothetical protein